MAIVVWGISHHTAPVEVRERFAVSEARVPDLMHRIKNQGIASEGVILSTCNRVEIYLNAAVEPLRVLAELRRIVADALGCAEPAANECYAYQEPHSVEHLCRVASGMDSMVLGETEILGQLKKAYETALNNQWTGARLNKAFQRAFQIAKHIRTETQIQRGTVSVGSAAVDLAERIFETIQGRQVLVIGAGDTSEKTARSLLSRGARTVLVANRSFDRAAALAEALGGRAVRWDDWNSVFAETDIVISSTAAPHFVLDRAKLEPLMDLRRNRPLLLIDIAVPRDIDPEVNFLDNVFLYNIDDLQSIADDSMRQRQRELERCEEIIREKVRELLGQGTRRYGGGDGCPKPASV